MVKSPVYIIKQQTKAILSKDSAYYHALIIEGQRERHSIYHPEQIIDHSCILYGSTLDGRRNAAKKILKISSKVPISVIPEEGVYMLPTSSIKSKNCAWLSYYQISDYEQRDNKTYVTFSDGTGLFVSTSERSFDLQMKRTSQLIASLNRSIFFPKKINSWNP